MLVPDTIQLERLAWAVFDNIMGLGEAPPLCGFETYDQIVGCLASKAYKGVHMCCPAHTSASFGTEVTTSTVVNPESRKSTRPPRYTMTRDVREEFRGSYSAYKEKQDIAERDQSYAPTRLVDPNTQGMKWMKERQRSYKDIQLEFWLLLRPLMEWKRGTYLSTSPQTPVCLALVFGSGSSHVPSRAYIHEHWILAAPN